MFAMAWAVTTISPAVKTPERFFCEIDFSLLPKPLFISPEFVAFVLDSEDDIVGFGVTMPSVTRALQISNGKFFPFGWINLLKSVYYNDTIDMYLVGVHPDYHGKGAAALVWKYLHEAYRKYGITKAYSNPQLEDNARALSIWKSFEGRQIIRRRCWVKHF